MNIEEMQAKLMRQIELLDAGDGDPERCNAMANAAGKLIGTIRLQMDFARMIGVKPNLPLLVPAAK